MSSNKNWNIQIDENVYKELVRIPKKDADQIISIIEDSLFNPYGGDIEKIKGEQYTWRRRIGTYRIFYEVHQERRLVHIFRVERRTSSTY